MKKLTMSLLTMLLVCSCGGEKGPQEKAPVSVKTEMVQTASATGGQTYVGIVEEREATAVSFTTLGVVQRMWVSEGQAVSKDQLIAELDDTQARNMFNAAEATKSQAEDALTRYRQLHDSGSLPEVQWVDIQSKVAQAESQWEMAKKNLDDCSLKAPVAGIIGRKMVNVGESVAPSQPLVTILDISSVKVKVSVPEAEISGIRIDTPSFIRVEATGRSYNGGRIEKGVQADALTHTYDIRIQVPNNGRELLPGMVASVSFSGQEAGSAQLMVPLASVQRKADGTLFVWTVDTNDTAHRTEVTIGQVIRNRVAVSTGLSAGQRIVTEGWQKLSEGSKIANTQ